MALPSFANEQCLQLFSDQSAPINRPLLTTLQVSNFKNGLENFKDLIADFYEPAPPRLVLQAWLKIDPIRQKIFLDFIKDNYETAVLIKNLDTGLDADLVEKAHTFKRTADTILSFEMGHRSQIYSGESSLTVKQFKKYFKANQDRAGIKNPINFAAMIATVVAVQNQLKNTKAIVQKLKMYEKQLSQRSDVDAIRAQQAVKNLLFQISQTGQVPADLNIFLGGSATSGRAVNGVSDWDFHAGNNPEHALFENLNVWSTAQIIKLATIQTGLTKLSLVFSDETNMSLVFVISRDAIEVWIRHFEIKPDGRFDFNQFRQLKLIL